MTDAGSSEPSAPGKVARQPVIEGQWVAVTERLPEYGQPCLVGWDGTNAYKTPQINRVACAIEYTSDGWLWYEHDFGDFCEWDSDEVPTHWMPLPSPPTASGSARSEQS